MVPLAHESPQSKRHLDRFSYFCTAHCRISSGMPRHVLSPTISFSMGSLKWNFYLGHWWWWWWSGSPSNTWFLGPTRVHSLNGMPPNMDSSVVFSRGANMQSHVTQNKRHLDRFSHLSIAHGSVVGHTRTCPFPKNCPFAWSDLNPHLIHSSLCPP